MKRRSTSSMAVVSAALLCGLAGVARGQCDFLFTTTVPDFDQNRKETSSVAGLPADGANYCVPTSISNWFAYFANSGLPQTATFDGYHDWSSNTNYDRVTSVISIMGDLMNTIASGDEAGTTGSDGLYGAQTYSNTYCDGKVTVTYYWALDDGGVTPFSMFLTNWFGGYMAACYGYYGEDSTDHYTRDGGHCITIVRVEDACGSNPSISYRNPATTAVDTSQSAFATASDIDVFNTAGDFRDSDTASYEHHQLYRLDLSGTLRFLDGLYILIPTFTWTWDPGGTGTGSNTLRVIQPWLPPGVIIPPQVFQPPPDVGTVIEVIPYPEIPGRAYYATAVGAGVPSSVYRLDQYTSQSTLVMTGTDIQFIEFSRYGELYVCDGAHLSLMNILTTPATQIAAVDLAAVPESMRYDDATDTLALLMPPGVGPRHIARYTRNLSAVSSVAPLPVGVTMTGPKSMSFGRTGNIFLAGSGSSAVYKLSQSGNTLNLVRTISLPQEDHPNGLNANDADHILYVSGGTIHEYAPDANGVYLPDTHSVFAGVQAGPRLSLWRARTNHDASHEGPSFRNIPDPFPEGIPDCYANCDLSTQPPVLNANDFQCFLNHFAAGRAYANCDHSATPPVLNANDFQCFLNSFAAGCQ